jgi:AraC-like DNA-binding protein
MAQVSILRYNSEVSTIKGKVRLEQNLFSFLLEGTKSIFYAGEQATIGPAQFFLLTAGQCLMTEKIAGAGGQYRSTLIFFDNELLADFLVRHPRNGANHATRTTEAPFLVLDKDPFLVNFIESLGYMLDSGQSLSPEMQKVKLEELLLYLSTNFPEQISLLRRSAGLGNEELMIRQTISSNIDQALTVEELAFLCHMSLSTFKRRFLKLYGTSPNKWLLEQRMQKAAVLLTQRNKKASEIFYELGYENLSSFVQSFKLIHGVTPKQYQLLN